MFGSKRKPLNSYFHIAFRGNFEIPMCFISICNWIPLPCTTVCSIELSYLLIVNKLWHFWILSSFWCVFLSVCVSAFFSFFLISFYFISGRQLPDETKEMWTKFGDAFKTSAVVAEKERENGFAVRITANCIIFNIHLFVNRFSHCQFNDHNTILCGVTKAMKKSAYSSLVVSFLIFIPHNNTDKYHEKTTKTTATTQT